MASAKALDGILKWSKRDEWRELLAETLDLHLSEPVDAAGIEHDQLERVIGEDAMALVSGCAIEDFLTSERDDGVNIVDDYLKRRGWKESVPNRRYLTALRFSIMSLYEVSDVVRGQSFLARDLLRGGEPVRVVDRFVARDVGQWDRIATRLVKLGERFEIAGGVLQFSHHRAAALGGAVAATLSGLSPEQREVLKESQVGGEASDERAIITAFLSRNAAVFTRIWLQDALEQAQASEPPEPEDDGAEFVFTTVRFPLEKGIDRAALEAALTAIPDLRHVSKRLWIWAAPQAHQPSGYGVLEAQAFRLETNSPQRAEESVALLGPVIGRFVGKPVVTQRPTEAAGRHVSSGLSAEEENAIVRDSQDRHYRHVLDQPEPMLGSATPREAATTPEGREQLVAWLKALENFAAHDDSGYAAYDFGWMWDELGVSGRRR